MRQFGFSTWGWESTFIESVLYLATTGIRTIELSSLRWRQFLPMMIDLNVLKRDDPYVAKHLMLATFNKISFHAPSDTSEWHEAPTARVFSEYPFNQWPIILHPDCIHDTKNWQCVGEMLLIENMDARKHTGQTVESLLPFFAALPDARFCFDIGHAQQVDPTMKLAHDLVDAFGHKMAEVHMSIVAPEGGVHNSLTTNDAIVEDFRKFAPRIPESATIILEVPSKKDQMKGNIEKANWIFSQ